MRVYMSMYKMGHARSLHSCVSHSCFLSLASGALHEYMGHERLLLRYIYYSPPTHVVSGRMARADVVYISLERPGVPGAGRSPGSAGGGSWLAHRSRIMLGVRDGYQNDAACTAVRAVRSPIVDGRTQWMVLSATINNPEVASCLGAGRYARGLLRLAVAKHSVIVDHGA